MVSAAVYGQALRGVFIKGSERSPDSYQATQFVVLRDRIEATVIIYQKAHIAYDLVVGAEWRGDQHQLYFASPKSRSNGSLVFLFSNEWVTRQDNSIPVKESRRVRRLLPKPAEKHGKLVPG